MKKWHYFLVALFAVFCSSAIVIGSSVNSYVGANRVARAIVPYEENVSDDSPYWEQVTITGTTTGLGSSGFAYDGKYYFNVDFQNLTMSVFDSSTMSISSVSFVDNADLGEYDAELAAYEDYIIYDNEFLIRNYAGDGYFSLVYSNGFAFDYAINTFADYSVVLQFDNTIITNGSLTDSFDDMQIHCFFNSSRVYYQSLIDETEDGFIYGLYYYDVTTSSVVNTNITFNGVGDLSEIPSSYDGGLDNCWTDGLYIYKDIGSSHYRFNESTYQFDSYTWSGYTGSFSRSNVWSDGNDIYMTLSNGQTYKLHVENAYVSPYPNVLSELIALMTGGIAGFASGIGENLSVLAESIFVDATTGGLSAFGGLVVIFAGIALALGLSRWAVNFITSLGKRNR